MSPEDPLDRLERLYEGLLKSYGALEKADGVREQQINERAKDITDLGNAMRASAREFTKSLKEVDERCEARIRRIEGHIREQGVELRGKVAAVHKRLDDERARSQWTVKERVVLYAAILSPMAGAVALFVQRAAGG